MSVAQTNRYGTEYKITGKLFPLHAVMAYGESTGMATLIFKVSTRPTEIKGGFINK
jgi:hypothetical protein